MANLRKITIEKFRGFDAIEVDEFSKINIFVGKNNVGKSSILESLFLLFGMSNPELANRINMFRGVNIKGADSLIYLFHDLKIENNPILHCVFDDNSERSLNIKPYKLNVQKQIDKQNDASHDIGLSTITTLDYKMDGISFLCSDHTVGSLKREYENHLVCRNGVFEMRIKGNKDIIRASLITNSRNDGITLSCCSEIIKRNEKAILLDLLKDFDVNIEDIQVLPDGIYFKIKNVDVLVPMSIMGDGLRRFLNIAASVMDKNTPFVCIDEIENGLHYSSYKLLWKALLEFSNKYNVQLFITTHNIETIACLKSLLEEADYIAKRGCVKVFTVAKTEKAGYKTYGYSYDSFKDAIDNETEMRS